MRLFVSAGEPSGDLHGANLLQAMQHQQAGIEYHGFGGERMAAAGCRLLFPLCDLALVGFTRVLGSLPRFARLLQLADRFFAEQRPDAVVLIDFPGFHWWLARRAKAHGVPVIYFVPPQLWAWAGWRVGKMRRFVDHVLCNLPFEEAWYRQRHVAAQYVGHPYFDELREQRLDPAFVTAQQARPAPVIALLPGSRGQELDYNLPSLIRAASLIHARRPDVRFLMACLKPGHRRRAEDLARDRNLPLEVHAGKTPEIIQIAHSCIAVSGSVGLELLYRGKPSVVVYRQNRVGIAVARVLMCCRYISLVNLLADKELFPEFLTSRCEAQGMAGHILHWLDYPASYEAVRGELTALRERVAEPGACARAAAFTLGVMKGRNRGRQAA
jgi:lipid-A-disaccharide synthase